MTGFRLTKNLMSGIQRLVPIHPEFWWIDALCINQDDAEEKNEQVRMMRSMYEKATNVWVWLGEEGVEDFVPALNLMAHLRKLVVKGR